MFGTQYGLSEFISNVLNVAYTKLFFPGSRLIRRPFYLRGRSHLDWGIELTIGRQCRFDLSGNGVTLRFGQRCKINDYVHIVAHNSVDIGDDVLIASNVFITDTSHGYYSNNGLNPHVAPDDRPLLTRSTKIGSRVWIGEGVCILPGVELGDGCIVGANAVVTKSFPCNCVIAGVPARILKEWDEKDGSWLRIPEDSHA